MNEGDTEYRNVFAVLKKCQNSINRFLNILTFCRELHNLSHLVLKTNRIQITYKSGLVYDSINDTLHCLLQN